MLRREVKALTRQPDLFHVKQITQPVLFHVKQRESTAKSAW
jgi:hypothetical protein